MTEAQPAPSLVALLGALRDVMSEERRAIGRLDVSALESLTAAKRDLVGAFAAVRGAPRVADPEIDWLIAQTRIELGANAALIAAAGEAVAAALGVEPSDSYDRAARALVTTRPMRVIAF